MVCRPLGRLFLFFSRGVFRRTVLRLGLFRQILDGDALAGICFVVLLRQKLFQKSRVAQVDIPNEAVVDHHPLGAVFALALRLVDVDVVDQLLQ